MAILFLIRHCEPELRGVILGQIDSPLSGYGRHHASTAFGQIEVATTWCSPLKRALETAAHVRSQQLNIVPQLREIDHGQWSGKTWAKIEAGWPDLARCKLDAWNGVAAPGGERWSDFLERVSKAWSLVRNGPQPAAVVAHHGVNAALMNIINGTDPLQFVQTYGEVIRVEYD